VTAEGDREGETKNSKEAPGETEYWRQPTTDGRRTEWGGAKALSDSTRRCPYITVGAHV